MVGQRLYIVTSQQDASSIYRNIKSLQFDEFVRDIMLFMGVSQDGVRKMWESSRYDSENSNRLHKVLAHAAEDYYRQQLLSGNHLEDLWTRIQYLISTSLIWDNIPRDCTIIESNDTKSLSLLK